MMVRFDSGQSPQAQSGGALSLGTMRKSKKTVTDALFYFREQKLTEGNYSFRTIAEYERALQRLEDSLGERRICDLEPRELEGVLHSFPAGSAPSAFSSIAAALNWLDGRGFDGLADLLPSRRPRRARRERYLSDEEYRRLWTALHDSRVIGGTHKRMVQALRFAVLVPLRRSELVSLAWQEVDIPGKRLNLFATKTGDRVVPMSDTSCAVLLECPTHHHYVFPGSKGRGHIDARATARAFERFAKKAGLNRDDTPRKHRVTLHTLRHSWASKAMRDGVRAEHIRRVMGHSTAWMSMRYAHATADDLRDGVDLVDSGITGSYQLGLPLPVDGGQR